MFLYFNVSDRNGLYAKRTSLFVIVTQHSNSHVHEALEIIFFTGYVISSVVNMTPEKYNVSELSIFLRSKMKKHWTVWICPSGVFKLFQTCHLVRIVRIQYGFWPFLR